MHHPVDPTINVIAIALAILLMLASCWRTLRTPRSRFNPRATVPVPQRELPSAPDSADGTLLAVRRALAAQTIGDSIPRRTAASGQSFPTVDRRDGARALTAGGKRRNRYRRTPWYQQKIMVASATLLVLLGTVVSAGAWYATSLMSSLDDLSTPPPEISGEVLDGNADTVIDTGPAQEQVERERTMAEAPIATPVSPGSLTVLVMGVDARPGQPIDIQVRADSLAVVHINPDTGLCRMLSIPRDTRVILPGYGYSKANHALAIGGVPYQQLVVEQYLGIEMDHYGLIDLAGVTRLVDAVGGITVENLDYPFEINGHKFGVGTLELSGEEVTNYVQFRSGPDGDYGRQKRHQQVIRSLLQKSAGLDILTALPDVLSAVRGHIRTDTNGRGLMDLAQTYRSTCTADSLETTSLRGEVWNDWDDLSGQELSFVHVEDAELQAKLEWLLGKSDDLAVAGDSREASAAMVTPMQPGSTLALLALLFAFVRTPLIPSVAGPASSRHHLVPAFAGGFGQPAMAAETSSQDGAPSPAYCTLPSCPITKTERSTPPSGLTAP
jgi:LCP family protein required for cell wall assembly